jgi:hypothetical protein
MKKDKFIGDGYPLERIFGNRIPWLDDSVISSAVKPRPSGRDIRLGAKHPVFKNN